MSLVDIIDEDIGAYCRCKGKRQLQKVALDCQMSEVPMLHRLSLHSGPSALEIWRLIWRSRKDREPVLRCTPPRLVEYSCCPIGAWIVYVNKLERLNLRNEAYDAFLHPMRIGPLVMPRTRRKHDQVPYALAPEDRTSALLSTTTQEILRPPCTGSTQSQRS